MLYTHILRHSISWRYPRKVLENAWYAMRSTPKAPTPFKLKLENTTVCNLKCNMCPHGVGLKRPIGSISYENYRHIFDQIYPCYLNLTGIGEPFLNKDIYKIIAHARSKNTFVKLDTNATLLNRNNGLKMLESSPNILSISIDGMKKDTYEKIRVGANFEKVIENTENFVKLKKEVGNTVTNIHTFMVVQQENLMQLPEYIKWADKIGVDSINGTFVIRLGMNENTDLGLNKSKAEDIIKVREELKEVLRNVKTDVRIANLINFLYKFDKIEGESVNKGHNKTAPCFLPWYTPYITWDGNVCPCDFYAENEIVFGNVFEEPFMKIWNNEKARAFRRQLIKKRVGICSSCGVNESEIFDKYKFVNKIPVVQRITHRKN
ncbi:SPASM domain-containing protein [Candidatus Woesearchaeota archaeon]|nr:SPASM domain-containing protein [Candidatus Woesearchaeota archaeon]